MSFVGLTQSEHRPSISCAVAKPVSNLSICPYCRDDARSEPGARMRRRDFFGVLGGAAACQLAVRAQSKAAPLVGVTKHDDFESKLDSLLQQAQQLGAPVAAI